MSTPDAMSGRAGDGERLGELGAPLLTRLSAVLRTARTHDVANQAFQRVLAEFLNTLQRGLDEEEEVALVSVADYFYLNGVRIRAQAALLPVYHALLGEFERRSLGGIRFMQNVTAPELERFVQLFLAAEDPALAQRLIEATHDASIHSIVPIPAEQVQKDDLARTIEDRRPSDERGRAKRVFWRAVLGSRKILLRAHQTGRPDLRQAKRLVQPVVDSIVKHEYSIVGLTALKEHDEYTHAHCVNVSVLSVSMGQALGLARQALADLGVAALLHDIGKVAVPGEVLRKPDRLDPNEWQVVQRHPIEGVRMMTRMPGLSTLTLDGMRVCLEHHMNFDRTGYPDVGIEWGQSTLARIVAAADCFDAMTAHRAYSHRPLSPFEALQYMMGPARVRFDPAVLWSLVRTVGLYPAGTVMETKSQHVVLSISPNPADLRRPFCRVLLRPDGTAEPADSAATWDPMPASESVHRVLQPEEISIDTQEKLAA